MSERRSGLVPYLFVEDGGAMVDWYRRVFGFEEHSRFVDDAGRVTNAELKVGDTELWLDGSGAAQWEAHGRGPTTWIGVWVEDPDAVVARIRAAGVEVDEPVDKPYGIRMSGSVTDPAGYRWGFMRRID
jgi:uncharacterized glyoxalase superfamily protein PhnB